MRKVVIKESPITLGQFLKFADFASSGGEARALLEDGLVCVNDEVEVRRGRKLYSGDVVSVGDERAVVVTGYDE